MSVLPQPGGPTIRIAGATTEPVAACLLGGDQGCGQPGQQRLETVALATDLFGMNLRDLLHEIALAIHIGELFEYDPGRAIDADTIALLKCSAFQRFGPIENRFVLRRGSGRRCGGPPCTEQNGPSRRRPANGLCFSITAVRSALTKTTSPETKEAGSRPSARFITRRVPE